MFALVRRLFGTSAQAGSFGRLLTTRLQPYRRGKKRSAHSNKVPPLSVEALEARDLLTSFTPIQIRHAYGFDRVGFENATHALVAGDGKGQTIGIVDAYDDPNVASDLATFDTHFGLAAPPSFSKVNQRGASTYPTANKVQATETALDVEYAHAMAPGANILLVEADDGTYSNLFTAVQYAANHGASAVSLSYSGSEFSGTPSETSYDSTFNHGTTTYFASTGDGGQPGGYPAYSPNVVAVGGTSLTLDASNNYSSESGWSGSGGGISQYESQPAYQKGVVTQSTTKRTIPDVSFVADPSTGVTIYDTYGGTGYYNVGGTSVAAPMMAGLSAVVNQGNAYLFNGFEAYSGGNYLTALYHLAQSDFNDITTGNNGYAAGAGYDLVTGRGTPIVDRFVSAMDGVPVYNPLDGSLLVTGGAHGSNDTITLSQSGSQTVVQISSSIPLPGADVPFNQTFAFNAGQLNAITVATSDGTNTVNIQNTTGVTVNLADHGNTTVNVGNAGNTVNVWETDQSTTTTIHGDSAMKVNVGKDGSVRKVSGAVILDNPPSFTWVNVDDSADRTFRTPQVGVTSFGGSTYAYVSGLGDVNGLAPATIYTKLSDTSLLTVRTGTGGATANVLATGVPMGITGNGPLTVNVGNAGSLTGITHDLTVTNTGGVTGLYVDDHSSGGTQTATLDTFISSDGTPFARLQGLSWGRIYEQSATTGVFSVHTGTGPATANVLATGAPTGITGNGPLTVNVGNAGSLTGITHDLTVTNTGGVTGLYVDDHNRAGTRTATLDAYTSYDGTLFARLRGLTVGTIYGQSATTGIFSVHTGTGPVTANVLATAAPMGVSGNGPLTVNVGNAGSLAGIAHDLTVTNTGGVTGLYVDDSNSTGTQTATLDTFTSSDGTPFARLRDVMAAGTIYGQGATTGALTVSLGSGSNVVDVEATLPGTTTTLNGGGSDTFSIAGQSGNLDSIQGAVTIHGSGADTLTVNDQGTRTARIFGLDYANLSWGAVNVAYSGAASVTLDAGTGGDDFIVLSTSPGTTTTINGGGAQDQFIVEDTNAAIDAIQGPLALHGLPGSSSSVTLDDSNNQGDQAYDFDVGMVTIGSLAPITYDGVASVTLYAGGGSNTFSVAGTLAGTTTTLNGGAGWNQFVVDDSGTDAIQGALALHGSGQPGSGSDLLLYDAVNPVGQTYTLTAGLVTRTDMAPITYDGVGEVTLATNKQVANTVNVQSNAADVALFLDVGSGDTVYLGEPLNDGSGTATLADIAGSVAVYAPTLTPTVIVDNSADTTAHDVTTGQDDNGVYLDGLAAGRLYFNTDPTANVQVNPGRGDVTGLDAFFALLGQGAQP